jgi:hypothetical protein
MIYRPNMKLAYTEELAERKNEAKFIKISHDNFTIVPKVAVPKLQIANL